MLSTELNATCTAALEAEPWSEEQTLAAMEKLEAHIWPDACEDNECIHMLHMLNRHLHWIRHNQ